MADRKSLHETMVAGIRVNHGTLTGAATRHLDGKKVLVTNLHIVSLNRLNPKKGEEKLFQGDVEGVKRQVGSLLDWEPIVWGQKNVADVAICEISAGVDAEFVLHNHPVHDDRPVMAGVVEPWEDMKLTFLGSESGEATVTVKEVDEEEAIGGVRYIGRARGLRWGDWRRRADSNRRIEVLQTSALDHLATSP